MWNYFEATSFTRPLSPLYFKSVRRDRPCLCSTFCLAVFEVGACLLNVFQIVNGPRLKSTERIPSDRRPLQSDLRFCALTGLTQYGKVRIPWNSYGRRHTSDSLNKKGRHQAQGRWDHPLGKLNCMEWIVTQRTLIRPTKLILYSQLNLRRTIVDRTLRFKTKEI